VAAVLLLLLIRDDWMCIVFITINIRPFFSPSLAKPEQIFFPARIGSFAEQHSTTAALPLEGSPFIIFVQKQTIGVIAFPI